MYLKALYYMYYVPNINDYIAVRHFHISQLLHVLIISVLIYIDTYTFVCFVYLHVYSTDYLKDFVKEKQKEKLLLRKRNKTRMKQLKIMYNILYQNLQKGN